MYNVAVVGATGLVGREILKILEERNFPLKNLKLLASAKSKGLKIKFKGEEIVVDETTNDSFSDVDIALFASAEAASDQFAWEAVKRDVIVIDNSSTFRMDKRVPLVVPEVNKHALKRHQGLIANPNCSTIQMVVVLKPLHDFVRIKRVVVSTYQSVSGWGKEAVEQLLSETKELMKDEILFSNVLPSNINRVLPYQIAFNIIPQIDKFTDSGYTKEELKMVQETKKIMEDDKIEVTATCVRVPVFIGHSEVVNIEFEDKITKDDAKRILQSAKGVVVIDFPENKLYPMPINVENKDEVFVGRIREDRSVDFGLDMFIVSNNLRKGAATNAVQIAECIIELGLI